MMGVSTKILKMCNSLVNKLLSYICNKSIETGVFPDRLKYAIVKPLYKMVTGLVYQITGLFLYYWFFQR